MDANLILKNEEEPMFGTEKGAEFTHFLTPAEKKKLGYKKTLQQ